MRITVEWHEERGTCSYHRYATFEGETREEIDAQIRDRVGSAETMIVGLHNDLDDYAAYTGRAREALASEYPYGFRDLQPLPPEPTRWDRFWDGFWSLISR